jgi:hypothetical protein
MGGPEAERPLVPNRRDVAHEAFDGEVILIHFPSGRYFRLDAAGKVGWSAVEHGATRSSVAQALRASFEVDERAALASAGRFLEALASHGLVVEGTAAANGAAAAPPTSSSARAPFSEPAIEVFTDLQELFLVDPIHDVDETGWPSAKR